MDVKRVYLETSVLSYLTARPSRDLVVAARQQVTLEWWERRRRDFELVSSELVLDEARRGDSAVAQDRLAFLAGLALLRTTPEAEQLAGAIISAGVLPDRAFADALHIAVAAVHEVDYLMTWNCTHIANAEILPRVGATCRTLGFDLPFICTPDELLGDEGR
jgi:predicted nucleic acid-binding protein